jgi:predicted nucleic acid-binding protein
MSDDRSFVDSNVMVYAYDNEAGEKHATANRIVTDLWQRRSGALSTQVLQEFYVTVTRKLPKPLARRVAREVVRQYRAWSPHRPDVEDLIAGSELEERHRLSFWDALVVVSAQRCGAMQLISEDLNDGQRFGPVTVVNPFRP